MFSRILFFLPFVALAIANPLVARSDISALQNDFTILEKDVLAIQNACDKFKATPSQFNAMAFAGETQDLDNDIKKAIPDVPDHVVTDSEGQDICDTLTNFLPNVIKALDCLDSAKSSFATAGIPTLFVCSIANNLNADNTNFINRLNAASPASAQACAKELTDQVVAKEAEVKATYNC